MFALIDCNAFFVSCERVFQPHLERKPVIVLSSNDGCAISRSNEAKALGIQMGDPFFKIKDIIKEQGIHVFSSNFSLYGDMSSRVMATLKAFSSSLEIYSIDEAFLDLKGLPQDELFSYGCTIKKIVKQWTGIPVSVGIGPTKTLAKVANHVAKRHPAGCHVLLNQGRIETILKDFPLQKVWGVGPQWSEKLSQFNIKTAFDLAHRDINWIKKIFNVVLARTALELKGISCLKLEEISSPKKSIISSRSFGTPFASFESLRESVSFHASSLAHKLRTQGSKTSLLSVSLQTKPFGKNERVYTNTHLVPLLYPSQDTSALIKAAVSALEIIFREGLSYKKAGVMVSNLSPENQKQAFLFEEMESNNSLKRKSLFKTLDKLNLQYGKNSLVFASEGLHKTWKPKAQLRSPSYTYHWDQLPRVG